MTTAALVSSIIYLWLQCFMRDDNDREGTIKDCQSKEASILWSHYRKQGGCLEKEIMQGTMAGARRRGRPRTA